jgi:hypothetical protein
MHSNGYMRKDRGCAMLPDIHANETNEQRKRYEISVSLNDPGSVVEHSLLVPVVCSLL